MRQLLLLAALLIALPVQAQFPTFEQVRARSLSSDALLLDRVDFLEARLNHLQRRLKKSGAAQEDSQEKVTEG